MLNWNKVLRYCRGRTALPSSFIEKTDEEIQEWLTLTSLADFSQYYPDWERTGFNISDSSHAHATNSNWFHFFDAEDLEIFGIRECFFPMGGMLAAGHPHMSPMSFGGGPGFALEVFKSRTFAPLSMWSYTYKFVNPNIVELPNYNQTDSVVVEYERRQPDDLRKIPAAMERIFMELCCSDFMIWIGGMRTMYQGVNTPFGEVNINGEQLESKGQDLKREVMEKLIEDSKPPVIIDVY